MLFQVEKLDSGVVQRPKQACGKMSGGFPPHGEEGGWAQVSGADDNNDILRDEGDLCLHNTLKQEGPYTAGLS